jgi:hypothetical protein
MLPTSGAVEVFAATEKPTVPFEVPFAPDVTVIHEFWLTAVQLHPPPAVTEKLPVPATSRALVRSI